MSSRATFKEVFKKLKLGISLVAVAGIAASVPGIAFAEIQFQTEGGLKVFDPCNNAYWFGLGGRLEVDEIIFSGKAKDLQDNFKTSSNIRRAFLALNGGVGDCWIYDLTLNFGRSRTIRFSDNTISTSHGTVLFEEAWLGYTGLMDNTLVRLGQFTPLTTMDGYGNYGINNGQMFLESALATSAFSVPSYPNTDSRALKGLGIILNTQFCDMFTMGATIYEAAHGPENVWGDPNHGDRIGGALRFTYSPVHEEGCVYHVGILGRYQSLNHTRNELQSGNNGASAVVNNLFFTTPEVIPRNYVGVYDPGNFASTTGFTAVPLHSAAGTPVLLDAGAQRAKAYNHIAAEAATIRGPLTAEAEYHYTTLNRLAAQPIVTPFVGSPVTTLGVKGNVHFHGWHAQAGYFLTGESRCYDFANGTLGGVKPASDCGAWEIAARYSYLNLIHKEVYGGSARNATLGLNWYLNCNVRFAFNYIHSIIRPTDNRPVNLANGSEGVAGRAPLPNTPKRNLDIFALRAQLVF